MGKQFPEIDDTHRQFIDKQKVFFVATAASQGRINVSPKGLESLRVLGPKTVAYLDSTGSGSETAAHLRSSDPPRMTIMFCAFEGAPMILRLYGEARAHLRGSSEYRALIDRFVEMPGARQIVHLDVGLVQTSCGMGVPLFDYKEQRPSLDRYWAAQGPANLQKYWGLKNMRSIDGLPTGFEPETMSTL